jgi:wobble nucleotide-excising tRNase
MTISTISEEAKQNVIDHIKANLKTNDVQWIKKGLDLIKTENCPFCGKNLEGSEQLLTLYQQYFDEHYQQYQIKLQAFQRTLQEKISDTTLSQIQHSVEINNSIFNSNWNTISTTVLDSSDLSGINPTILRIRELSQRLITIKIADPLSAIDLDPEFDTLIKKIDTIPIQIDTYNRNIRVINEEIRNYKQKLQTSDLASAQRDLINWRMRKARYESPNSEICQTYAGLIKKKRLLENEKDTARANLVRYTNELLEHVEEIINGYLSQFNAGFQIVNFDTPNERGGPRLKYEIQLWKQNIELGSSNTSLTRPTFSNTLSDGDKRTLAFAFFLAGINLDPNLSDKIIIVDDPMSSLDQSRQFTTQLVLKSLALKGKQLIVLSHDPRFLQMFLENSFFPQENCVTFEIKRSNNDYSIITDCDLEDCIQSAYKKNYRTVSNYISQGQCIDKFFVVRAIRPLVEATLRNRFLDSLKGADGLGKMIDMIEGSQTGSPLYRVKSHVSKLKELNRFTSEHIHDTSATDSVQQIADAELNNYAKFALDLAQGS